MAQPSETQTIAITNFSGALTRVINGDLNSGKANFDASFGYDPFSKPGNLTWLEQPTDISHIDDGGGAQSLPLAAQVVPTGIASSNTSGSGIHVLMQSGKWYQISSSSTANGNTNSIIGISSVATQTYNFGASMQFFGPVLGQDVFGNNIGRLYVSNDVNVVSVNPNGGGETVVANANNVVANIFHPMKSFGGKLRFGNGNTTGSIDATNTVTSSVVGTGLGKNIYSDLIPPLDTSARVVDLESSISNDYLVLAAANTPQEERLDQVGYDTIATYSGADGTLFLWNGIDQTVTSATSIPSYLISEVHTYFKNNSFFANDSFGASLNDGNSKVLTLTNNKAPLPNAVCVNGNFLTWACPETDSTNRYMSFYYYGALDSENPTGLWRLLRWTSTQANGFVSKVPLNVLVSNRFKTINNAGSALINYGYGKHYIGLSSFNGSAQNFLLSFLVTPTGSGTPQLGVYQTQTQLFSNKITVKQVRVYTEPTATGNGFQLDMIGSDGSIISNSWNTNTYTFAAGTDPTTLQGSLERIDFTPVMKSTYALGLRITNTGTTNMTIKKIEVDWQLSGK